MLCRAIKLILIILLMPFFILAQEKVDINSANLEQLDTLIGIGPVYAQRIIDARPFSSVDDLIRVSGIGEKTLQKIKDQGLAYVGSQPMEKKTEETPKIIIQEEIKAPEVASDIVSETKPLLSYPEGIIISKIMPSPEGADADNEYIELKNTNNFEVDLQGWILRDKQGSIKEYTLGEKISALGTLILLRTQTQITLNNQGDGLELLNPLKEVVDSVDFGKAQTGVAFIKTASGWQWDILENPEKESKKDTGLAAVSEAVDLSNSQDQEKRGVEINLAAESKYNISIYLTGFFVAFASCLIFLAIKKKVLF